jgi:hypothetical protein
VPFSNRSLIATCKTRRTRIEINICRIDRICDTSSNSVSIDERIRNIFVGNADDDLFISTLCFDAIVCEDDSLAILFIDVNSLLDITGCSMISVIDSILAVCFISDENSSKRLVT